MKCHAGAIQAWRGARTVAVPFSGQRLDFSVSDATFHILGIGGSLRKGSYNHGLLVTAQELVPAGVEVEIADIASIPLYNDELNVDDGPEPVREFKRRMRAVDALLFAVPEYNYSMTGVQKNLIDWASRPLDSTPLRRKPVALMGAGGMFGTVRAQLALRQVLNAHCLVMNTPELHITRAGEHFDAEGHLTDEVTRQRLRAQIEALVAWAAQVSPRQTAEAAATS